MINPAHAAKKIVIFDLGGVVVQLNWEKTYELLDLKTNEAKQRFQREIVGNPGGDRGSYERFERGEISQDVFFQLFKEDLQLPFSPDYIAMAWEFIIHGPVTGIQEVIESISKDDYDLYAFQILLKIFMII